MKEAKWRNIDILNLPYGKVIARTAEDRVVIVGDFSITTNSKEITLYVNGKNYPKFPFTHYIPLEDILSLPTE